MKLTLTIAVDITADGWKGNELLRPDALPLAVANEVQSNLEDVGAENVEVTVVLLER